MEHFYQRFCKEGFDENGVLSFFEPLPADNFNFAYDVVDEIARLEPDRRAMVWCNVPGEERTFTFGEMKQYSDFWSVGSKRATRCSSCSSGTTNSGLPFSHCIRSVRLASRQPTCSPPRTSSTGLKRRALLPVSVRENAASHPMLMRPVRNIMTSARNGLCAALAKAGSPMMRRCPSVTGTGNG